MSILLKGINIEHSYREGKIVTPVLKGVNLEIQSSKMTAIVGKSGSGKSTLLHMLGTLDTPEHGQIFFHDTDITKLTDRQKASFRNRHLGFIYQFHHLLDDFTVLENVMLPLMIARADRSLSLSRAQYLLERVSLSERTNYLPSELSGGERQRVAIARAMVHSPDLILADEPTGNLDEGNAATVFDLFKELAHDEKTAVVMVTHDLMLANQCDEILEMIGGTVLPKYRKQESLAKKFNSDSEEYRSNYLANNKDSLDHHKVEDNENAHNLSSNNQHNIEPQELDHHQALQQNFVSLYSSAMRPDVQREVDDAEHDALEKRLTDASKGHLKGQPLESDEDDIQPMDDGDGAVIVLQQSDSNGALDSESGSARKS